MSFQSYTRNPSGVVFFGADGSETLYTSASTFTYDDGLNALKIPNGGYIGSQSDYDAISIASNGNVSLTQNLSIAGNLTVNGSTTTVSTTNLDVKDSLVMISSGTATPANDAGILIDRGSSTNAFMGWDESADKFIVGTTTADSNSTGDLSITAGVLVADLEGNADSATQLAASQNFSLTGQVSAGSVAFDGTGGVALSTSLGVTAITGQSTVTEAPSDAYIIMASGSALQKITKSNFVSDLGAMSSFTLAGTTGSSTVVDGDTLTIAASSQGMVSVAVSADTASISVTSAIADGTKNITFDSSNGIGIADAGLNSIAGLTTAANKMIYTTASDTYAVTDLSAFGRSLIDDADASAARTTLGLVIGTNVQAYNAILADLAGLTQATNALPYFDSATTAATTTLSAFGRSLIDDADASAARTTLGVAIGTDVQAYDADTAKYDDTTANFTGTLQNGGSNVVVDSDIGSTVQAYDAQLADVAGLTPSDGGFIVGNGTNFVIESAGTARTSLGLGSLATQSSVDLTSDVTGTLPVANGGTGATALDDIVSANTKLSVTGGTDTVIGGNVTLTINEGNIVHDNLSGFDANEHVDHSTISVSAGNGLTGGGTIDGNVTLTVGAGTGLTVGATTVGISNGGVDTTQLADGAVTEAKRERTVHSLSGNGGADKDITLVTTSSTNKTVYLPASPSTGQLVMIKKIDSGAGAVIVNASGSTIDDASTKNLYGQYESLSAVYNGSEWFVV